MSRKINNIPVVRIKLGVQDRRTIIEELKMQDQMAWVGKMNNIWACAEEIVRAEILK